MTMPPEKGTSPHQNRSSIKAMLLRREIRLVSRASGIDTIAPPFLPALIELFEEKRLLPLPAALFGGGESRDRNCVMASKLHEVIDQVLKISSEFHDTHLLSDREHAHATNEPVPS